MAREKGKYVRVSVDLTPAEYQQIKEEVTLRRMFIGAFLKDCALDVLADPLHSVKRVPLPPKRRGTYG